MSEEVTTPVEAPKAKQYLLMVDELHMSLLGKVMPGLLFVEVEGMAVQGNDKHRLLVNPIPPVTPIITTSESVAEGQ